MKEAKTNTKIVTTTCPYDCGSRCLLHVHIENNSVTKITTNKGKQASFKACLKGLSQKHVLHSSNRLTKPLLRNGPRGSGSFKAISWDDALNMVAHRLQKTQSNHGPKSILSIGYSGAMSALHNTIDLTHRFFRLIGGSVEVSGSTSLEGAKFASNTTFGSTSTGNSSDNFLRSKLIILWGWNPLVTRFGPDTFRHLTRAKKLGCKIIAVDPRFTQSAKLLAHRWIPIKPATDTAMLLAMAHVMIENELVDDTFLEHYTTGYEEFKTYVLGQKDGKPKTPQWASAITGVRVDEIQSLALEYATIKPAALVAGWAPGRTAYGEQYHRAAITLAAMTGNIGKIGGFCSGGEGKMEIGPMEQGSSVKENGSYSINIAETYKILLEGKKGGYPDDIKILYIVGCNLLNQLCNVNKGILALQQPDFIVCHELFMTPTATFADLVLPVRHFLEKEDIGTPWMGDPYCIYMHKGVDPLSGTRSDLEIFSELSKRMGFTGYAPQSESGWLKEFAVNKCSIQDFEAFKRKGIHQITHKKPIIAFQKQIEDLCSQYFETPSGKIEILSQRIEDLNNALIPSIPKYIVPWEGPSDKNRKLYPLQFISTHAKMRINSTLDNIPELKKHTDDRLWINTQDARERAIVNGDDILVFNQRGIFKTSAKVTDEIIKGVVSLDSGAWYQPGPQKIDIGGCVNTVTSDNISPAGAFACNSCLVEVVLAQYFQLALENIESLP